MIEDLNEFLTKEPFAPFRIVLSSGSSYVVTSPYQVVVERPRVRYYYDRADGFAILRLNQLVALEMLESPPPPAVAASE